jgi:hypothetical protein
MEKPKEIKATRLKDMGVSSAVLDRLADLMEAGREMRLGRVISEALEMFIETETRENEGIRRRFEELQKQRRAANNPGIRVVPITPEN